MFAAVVCLCTGTAEADPPLLTARLVWMRADGADGCPGASALEQAVALRLGRMPFAQDAPRTIEAIVTRDGTGWTARIYVRSSERIASGTRDALRGDTCTSIFQAVSLAIASILDPDIPSVSDPESDLSTPPNPQGARPCPSAAPPRLPLLEGFIVRVVGSAGLLPQIAPGVGFATTGRIGRTLRWSAGMTWFPEIAQEPDRGLSFGWTAGHAAMCGAVSPGARWTVALCGGGAVGAIHSVVHRLVPVRSGDQPWVGLNASGWIRFRIVSVLHVEVGAEALFPLTRQRFVIESSGELIFQQSPAIGMASFGVGVSNF
jgi:hypothetical protein